MRPRDSARRLGWASLRMAGTLWIGVLAALVGCARSEVPPPFPVADADPSDTAFVAPARWPGFPLLPDGRFPIAGWCVPPVSQTTDARYEEYARAGFTVVLNPLEDPHLEAPNRVRLEVAGRHGLFCVIRDGRMHPHVARFPGWRAVVDTVAATYRNYPALLAYFLADEPDPHFFPILGAVTRRLAMHDPLHPAHVNLLGQNVPERTFQGRTFSGYVRHFLDVAQPSFFSMDNYVLLEGRDVPTFCSGWDTTRMVAGEVPYWAILLLTQHGSFRALTEAELAWQANLALAHGARGIIWFTYWSPDPKQEGNYRGGPIAYDGTRNPMYATITRLNARIQALGQELAPLACLDVRHTGNLPLGGRSLGGDAPLQVEEAPGDASGRAPDLTFGFFADGKGQRSVLVVNRDYRNRAEVRLVAQAAPERWMGGWGHYEATEPAVTSKRHPLRVTLEPGQAELFRLVER